MPTLGIWELGNWETEKIQDVIPNEKSASACYHMLSSTLLRMIQKISPQCHCAPVEIAYNRKCRRWEFGNWETGKIQDSIPNEKSASVRYQGPYCG